MAEVAEFAPQPALDERFMIVESLGRGGQGRVLRAYDRLDRRDVAIKVLHAVASADRPHPLAAEFSAWSRLRHPYVVRAFEMLHAGSGPLPVGTPYLVLELVRGRPVHRALDAGAIPAAVLEELARRILHALDHVHAAGIVHRDLKPGNVLVGPGPRGFGRLKLTDFGLASESGRAGELGRISGSIPYVAPETILGLAVDGRADLYGLGVLLFYLATGELPVPTGTADRWLRWHLEGPPADPRTVRPDLPPRLAELVVALTARTREARPSTANEALRMLGGSPKREAAAPRALPASARAGLRLAIDNAGGGASRQIRIPRCPAEARAMRIELSVTAAARGWTCVHLHRTADRVASSLAHAVLKLLLAHGSEARALFHVHGLGRGLPLSAESGVPVWDRAGFETSRAPTIPSLARGVAAFFSGIAAKRRLMIVVDRSALSDPLVAAVVMRLRRGVSRRPRLRSESGGLVLALPTCARSRCRRTPST